MTRDFKELADRLKTFTPNIPVESAYEALDYFEVLDNLEDRARELEPFDGARVECLNAVSEARRHLESAVHLMGKAERALEPEPPSYVGTTTVFRG